MARHWRHPLCGVGQRNLYVKNAGRLIRPCPSVKTSVANTNARNMSRES